MSTTSDGTSDAGADVTGSGTGVPDRTDPVTALSLTALLRLQSWLSPAFPIGAYTCSHGLESAIADGAVRDVVTLDAWLRDVFEHGSGWNDAVVLRASHAAVAEGRPDELPDIAALAFALSAGAERHRESALLGASFRRAASAWTSAWTGGDDPLGTPDAPCPLPVAIGALAAASGLPALPVLASSLQSSAANLAWIATRLVPLGQSETLALLAALEPTLATLASRAERTTIDDLGGCAVLADIASLRHEHLVSRVCRT